MRYFDHDTTAASDDLIMALRLEHGGAAVDCYWAVIEQIYRDEGPVAIDEKRPETKALSVRLAIAYQELEKYVNTMISYGLLCIAETGEEDCLHVTSERAEENILAYQEKCKKARLNGAKGGKKSTRKANANRTAKRTLTKSGSDGRAKKRKGIEYLYGTQIPNAKDVADAEKSAPPSAQCDSKVPVCPLCASPVKFDAKGMTWRCGICGDVKEPEFVEPGDAA